MYFFLAIKDPYAVEPNFLQYHMGEGGGNWGPVFLKCSGALFFGFPRDAVFEMDYESLKMLGLWLAKDSHNYYYYYYQYYYY